MKMKSVILLVVAVGCGLVAMLGVQQVLSGKKTEGDEKVKVVIATADIAPGTPLNETNTAVREMDKENVPQGAVTDLSQIEGKTIRLPVVPNEILMASKLVERYGASYEIPEGMRVVTTSVNLTKTHSGMIRPGDRVDILLTYKIRTPDRGMMTRTKTVLEYIEIFAADNILATEAQEDSTEFAAKTLSFLVTPEQAALLKLAESRGELHLALRNKNDKEHVAVAAADESLLDDMDSEFGADGVYTGQEESDSSFVESEGGAAGIRQAIAAELDNPDGQTGETGDLLAEADVTEPAPLPTWPITIFSGSDVITQEVPLPPGESGMTEQERQFAERAATMLRENAERRARESAQFGEENALNNDDAGGDATTPVDPEQDGDDSAEPNRETGKWRARGEALLKGVLLHFLTGV